MPLGLADYKPKRRTIVVDEDIAFEVRGLSLKDVALIFEYHQGVVEDVYVRLEARKGLEASEAVLVETIRGVVESTPSVVATIIALASDSMTASSISAAALLPLPVQTEALTSIGELTFRDMAGAKKFIAAVKDLLTGLIGDRLKKAAAETELTSA